MADASAELTAPIERYMTAQPFYLSPQASAFDAAMAMTERHIAHVCLVDNQRLCGVVSERDLFSLQRVDRCTWPAPFATPHAWRTGIAARRDRPTGRTHACPRRLFDADHPDHYPAQRPYRVPGNRAGPGRARRSGRAVQLVVLWQRRPPRADPAHRPDNGILFEANDAAEAEAIRARLLPLAQYINQCLAQCGSTLCKGNVMAGNPELCLSRSEWARRFAGFIREASPENLLGSSIYFDLRVVWGDEQGCEQLRRGILEQVADNRIFQRMMADNALRQRPPVGRLREFVLTRQGNDKAATLDLKVRD